jgi:hypothetical protein
MVNADTARKEISHRLDLRKVLVRACSTRVVSDIERKKRKDFEKETKRGNVECVKDRGKGTHPSTSSNSSQSRYAPHSFPPPYRDPYSAYSPHSPRTSSY